MNLTHEQLAQINVEIDRYTIVPNTEKIGCECIIAGAKEYYTVVTFDELREALGVDDKGMIDIIFNNGDDMCAIHFNEWFTDMVNTGALRENLEQFINQREQRQPIYKVMDNDPFADIADMIDGIV